jgi:hypothetical protein
MCCQKIEDYYQLVPGDARVEHISRSRPSSCFPFPSIFPFLVHFSFKKTNLKKLVDF